MGTTPLEDSWYALAAKDLGSSSDDDLKGSSTRDADGKLSALTTPSRTEERRPTSPANEPAASEAALGSETPINANLGDKGWQPSQLRFDEGMADPEAPSGTAQERWQRTDAYMRDVQQAFRTRPAVRVQGSKRYTKLLLVGEPGLGKEIFTKNIFAPYCADNDLPVNCCKPETDGATFRDNPADFCTEVVVDVEEGRTKIHYLVQDTPGTHLPGVDKCILQYLLRQNREYMAMEEDPRRIVPLSSLPDPRVDVCLFFLAPHFLKPQDIALMTRLSEFVSVVPIIAKADALTTVELDAYRQHIRVELQQASLQVGRPVTLSFEQADLCAAGAVREVPPFAVVTSTEIDHEVGSHWFTRTFPWGICEVMSSSHSDLPTLKALLFEVCFEGLQTAKENRFYAARETYLTRRALSRALSSGELPTNVVQAARSDVPQPNLRNQQPPKPRQWGVPSGPFSKLQVPCPVESKSTRKAAEKSGERSWSWGFTVGMVTLAILVQLAALGYYARNTQHLRSLVAIYQKEAMAEKQVIAELMHELNLDLGTLQLD